MPYDDMRSAVSAERSALGAVTNTAQIPFASRGGQTLTLTEASMAKKKRATKKKKAAKRTTKKKKVARKKKK